MPIPEAANLAELNEKVLAMCVASRNRTIIGESQPISQASQYERAFLTPLAEEGFPLVEVLYPLVVDGRGRVKVKTNWYSARRGQPRNRRRRQPRSGTQSRFKRLG